MNRNEFYKQLMSEYTFDADKVRENAKRGKKRQKLTPLYVGMSAAAAAMVVTVGTIAMTNLGRNDGVSLTDTGLTTLSASDRLSHALQQLEQERESSESKDFLVTFAQPLTPAQAQSVLTAGGNIPVKQLYLSDGSRVSDADSIGGIFTGGGDQRITGAAVYCSGSFAAEYYLDHLASTVDGLEPLRVLIDCANGAASTTARYLFGRFPLEAEYLNDKPNGVNINSGCGSTHLEALCDAVKAGGYDLGIAFDGDADRCLTIDEQGCVIDGDKMMAICAAEMEKKGRLHGGGFVATVMSNIGLHKYCAEHGLRLLCASVGDRNVLELMQKEGMRLGGEQSGHIIFLDYMPTGDGQLAALQFLDILSHSGKKASELSASVRQYPQLLQNVRVTSNEQKTAIMQSDSLREAIQKAEAELGENGRVLIRPSGTEPLIRVMVEAGTEQQAQAVTQALVQHVENLQKSSEK